jgi:hypothetical protein
MIPQIATKLHVNGVQDPFGQGDPGYCPQVRAGHRPDRWPVPSPRPAGASPARGGLCRDNWPLRVAGLGRDKWPLTQSDFRHDKWPIADGMRADKWPFAEPGRADKWPLTGIGSADKWPLG